MTEEQILNDFKLHFYENKNKYLTSNYQQLKIHRKKRINKKWLKKYGLKECKRPTSECFEEVSDVIDKLIKIKMLTYFDNFADINNLIIQ